MFTLIRSVSYFQSVGWQEVLLMCVWVYLTGGVSKMSSSARLSVYFGRLDTPGIYIGTYEFPVTLLAYLFLLFIDTNAIG